MKMKCSKMNRRVIAGIMTLLLTVSVYAPAVMAEGSSTADFQRKVVARVPVEIGTETETGALALSLQDAIDLAMKNNDSIRSAELSLEQADITTEEGRRKWSNAVLSGLMLSTSSVDAQIYGLKAQDIQYQVAEITYDLTKETVAVGVQQLYWNIMLQQSAVEKAKSDLDYADRNYRNMQLRQTVGLVTQTQANQVKTQMESAKASLASAESNLVTAMDSLKRQMGLKAGQEIVLTEELPAFVPVDISDIDGYAEKMVVNAPTITMYDLGIDAKEYLRKINDIANIEAAITSNDYTKNEGVTYSQADTARQNEINVETAIITKEGATNNLRNTVRSLYYSAQTKEASYEALLAAISTAEEGLKIKQQMLELGMATQLDVLEVQNTLAGLKHNYNQLMIGHAIDVLKLAHPWC